VPPSHPRVLSSRRCAVGLLLASVLVLAACSNSTGESPSASPGGTAGGSGGTAATATEKVSIEGVPGVSDDKIEFSAFGTQANNPLGTCVLDCYTDGINAYFAWRNSQGGVQGRQMELTTVLDDELANNQARALEITSDDDTFAAFSATQVPSGWGDIADAGMPLYTWSIHPSEMAGQESIFGYTGALCTACTSRSLAYPASLGDATKVATLGYGISPNSKECAQSTARAIEKYSDDTGQEVVYTNDEMAFGLPNGVGPEVTAMKEAGTDFVIGCLDLNGMKTIAQELERQGMGDVKMFHPNTYDAAFVAEAGELFEGDIVGVRFRPFEADAGESQLADFREWMEETGSEISELAMIGWLNADLAYQGLVAAGPDFDREKVIAATNQITDFTAGGLIAPLDWTRQHEPPTEDDPVSHGDNPQCAAYVQVKDGKFELMGEADKPFFCWDPNEAGWVEPEPTNFE
jgi:ABC-type branched-subunit amino acid transport system substrate-binding protein